VAEFQDRLVWDGVAGEIRDGQTRYMLIRPDALMSVFRRLPAAERALALDAFRRSVTEFGGRSAGNYSAALAPSDGSLLHLIARTAPQLGWGIWTIETDAESLRVKVTNSPFAAGFGAAEKPVCSPIAGMLQAVAALAFARSMTITESKCSAVQGVFCQFDGVAHCEVESEADL
jgi:predicted hydrocarbon binding protein